MLIKISKSILLSVLVLCAALLIYKYRESNFENKIIKEALSQKNNKFDISGDILKCDSKENVISNNETISRNFKLLFRMNFDCSKCLVEVKEIYDFYLRLSDIHEIDFCLITTENIPGYVKFYLDKSLKNYSLWIISQKKIINNDKLILLSNSNHIIIMGDIIKYQFLKDEFLKHLEKSLGENKQMVWP